MMRRTNLKEESRGEQLVRTYIVPGLISFGEGELLFRDGRHEIQNASFPEEILMDEARRAKLLQDLPDLLELFFTAEGDHRLRIPRPNLSGRLWPYFRNEDATGITFLQLFEKGMLELTRNDAGFADLFAEASVFQGIPEAEKVLDALCEDIVTFHDGKPCTVRIHTFRRSHTEDLSDGLDVTYYLDDEFESRFGKNGSPLVPDRDQRMENVRKNRNQTLSRLAEMLQAMGKHTSD